MDAETYDAVVIGAGIVGAAVTFRLAQRGLHVLVLEAAKAPASGSTAKSAAGVRVQFSEAVNVRLSWRSIREYSQFESLYGLASGYKAIGYLFLVDAENAEYYQKALETQRRLGAPVKKLSAAEAQSLVKFDVTGVTLATWGEIDGIIDPHQVTMGYLQMAKRLGARVLTDTAMMAAERRGGAWVLQTPAGKVESPLVINAAGAWAGEVAARAGFELPVQPVRRMVYMTAPTQLANGLPLVVDVASGFYLRGEQQRILFGRSNHSEQPGFTEGMDWQWLEPTLEVGLARFPWLQQTRLDQRASWWGYYAVTPDNNPILGRMPGQDGWINAVGFSGHGVQQAAAVGQVIAEEAVEGRAQTVDIDELRMDRFNKGIYVQEHNIV